LLEAIERPIDFYIDGLRIDADCAISVPAKELRESAHSCACAQDAVLEVIRLRDEAVVAQSIGDHAGVHRPGGAVVIGAGAKVCRLS
jgi:hypothetical protein